MAGRGSDEPGEATFSLGDGDGRYVLVWLTQLAKSDACSANPYRGAIGGARRRARRLSVGPSASDDELLVAARDRGP